MKRYVESQQEVIRALSGCDQFWLCGEVAHYGVPTQSWVKMSPEERREVVSLFQKAKFPSRAVIQNTAAEKLDRFTSTSTSEVVLSVSAEDSGIILIPYKHIAMLFYIPLSLIHTKQPVRVVATTYERLWRVQEW